MKVFMIKIVQIINLIQKKKPNIYNYFKSLYDIKNIYPQSGLSLIYNGDEYFIPKNF